MDHKKLTHLVRQKAYELGFQACGFAQAGLLKDEAHRLETWLKEDRHGTMQWMENHFDKRVDPTKLVPGAKSVVSLLCSYHQPKLARKQAADDANPKISKYALGEDYHFVLKDKIHALFNYTKEINGGLEGRVFVDSAPVLDKVWAQKAGLGWMGKHTNLLNRKQGSWFFLGEMIVDAEFEYDGPVTDHCGSCTRCIDACPTDAIYEPYKVDGSKCISYLTIELREAIPDEFHDKMESWIFGCDICQDVCPWNRKAEPGTEPRLFAREALLDKDIAFWEELELTEFRKLFRNNPVKRTKFEGLKRNIKIVSGE